MSEVATNGIAFAEMNIGTRHATPSTITGTRETRDKAMTKIKQLEGLRANRDRLRGILATVDGEIAQVKEEVQKLTMELADQDPPPPAPEVKQAKGKR